MKDFNLILLSAGQSSRMGFPKAFLNFDKKTTFIEKIISSYKKVKNINKIIIVLNSKVLNFYKEKDYNFLENFTIIINDNPEKDRFHSIFLAAISQTKNNPSFIQNIDNPFIETNNIEKMIANYSNDNYLVSNVLQQNTHPILLNENIISEIKKANNFKGSLRDFLQKYNKKKVIICNEKLLHNINTPEDYKIAFKS